MRRIIKFNFYCIWRIGRVTHCIQSNIHPCPSICTQCQKKFFVSWSRYIPSCVGHWGLIVINSPQLKDLIVWQPSCLACAFQIRNKYNVRSRLKEKSNDFYIWQIVVSMLKARVWTKDTIFAITPEDNMWKFTVIYS